MAAVLRSPNLATRPHGTVYLLINACQKSMLIQTNGLVALIFKIMFRKSERNILITYPLDQSPIFMISNA